MFESLNKIDQYDLEGNFIKTWLSVKQIQRYYIGFQYVKIYNCCKNNGEGKNKNYRSFIWKYHLN